MRLSRIFLIWLGISSVEYALWQAPVWDGLPTHFSWVAKFLYGFQVPGMLVHGPHGGFGDWRDPAIVVPVTAYFYTLCTWLLVLALRQYAVGRLRRHG